MTHQGRAVTLGLLAAVIAVAGCGGPEGAIEDKLRENVIFYSNFEKGVDALWCEGSPLAEFDGANTNHQLNDGKYDGSLKFAKGAAALSYKARTNFPYSSSGFSGAVVFWLRTDTAAFDADYPEPFHIGKRAGGFPWDDAVIFVDFKKTSSQLRFGCYPDKAAEVSDAMADAHTITMSGAAWSAADWHHVAITWKNFNSGKANAEWALYVDGSEVGRKSNLQMSVTWQMDEQVFRFNHYGFEGEIDEIAVFKTSLEPADAAYLHKPVKPLNSLLKKGP